MRQTLSNLEYEYVGLMIRLGYDKGQLVVVIFNSSWAKDIDYHRYDTTRVWALKDYQYRFVEGINVTVVDEDFMKKVDSLPHRTIEPLASNFNRSDYQIIEDFLKNA